MDAALIDLLRLDLAQACYRGRAVQTELGAEADDARQRGVLAPARHVLAARDETPLVALIRLLLLGDPLEPECIDAALPGLGVPGALRLGLIAPASADGLHRAALSLNPILLPDPGEASPDEADDRRDWWILSDLDDQLRRGPARTDHVMGVGGATRSLIAQAPLGRGLTPPGRALDLGTGCGVIALQLARAGAQQIIATDVSERALRLARANARLNGIPEDAIDFRRGSLFEPVAGERFDLILSNPPFVITPRGDEEGGRYEYRDGGMAGDELIRTVVQQAPAHLRDGGELLCLANWESPWGQNGLERVRDWIAGSASASEGRGAGRLAAWVIERDRVSPARYAETWARDGGARPGDPASEALIEGWLRDFAGRRVASIGLGSIRVRLLNSEPDAPAASAVRTDQATGAFGDEPGPELARAFAAGIEADGMSDAEVLRRRWIRPSAVAERREYEPGSEAPRSIELHTARPIERIAIADTLLAAAVGACDGELTLGQISAALATLLEVDETGVDEALCAGARELVWLGMLIPAPR